MCSLATSRATVAKGAQPAPGHKGRDPRLMLLNLVDELIMWNQLGGDLCVLCAKSLVTHKQPLNFLFLRKLWVFLIHKILSDFLTITLTKHLHLSATVIPDLLLKSQCQPPCCEQRSVQHSMHPSSG